MARAAMKFSKALLDVLVVDVELLFERIQLGIVVDLPPLAVQHRILRLRDLPAVGVLETASAILCRQAAAPAQWPAGVWYFGPDPAAGQKQGRGDGGIDSEL